MPTSLSPLTQLADLGPLPSNSLVLAALLLGGVLPFSAGLARLLQELVSGLRQRSAHGHPTAMLVVLGALPLLLLEMAFQGHAVCLFLRNAMALPVPDLGLLEWALGKATAALSAAAPNSFWLKSPVLASLLLGLSCQLSFELIRWVADGRQRRQARSRADALLSAIERRNQEESTPARSPIRYF